MSNPGRPLHVRFWEKVDRSKDCWIWAGATNELGYGHVSTGWPPKSRGGKCAKAHRVAYELTQGAVPEGMLVLHRCDNPSCVRPDHLYVGTQQDNMRDRQTRGRASGLIKGAVRPTPPAVVEAIKTASAQGASTYSLSKRFDVARSTVSRILRRAAPAKLDALGKEGG